jgi:hypothetical protein
MKRLTSQPESVSTPLTHALFQLMAADGEDYPVDTGDVSVYWGRRLLHATFTKATGAQTLEFDLSTVGNHLYANPASYLAEDSIVLADQVGRDWFIRGVIRDP